MRRCCSRTQELNRIFEPFAQVDGSTTRKHGGLGLGLSIARSLVGMHDGSLTAFSDGAGKGATFSVKLPLEAARPFSDAIPVSSRGDSNPRFPLAGNVSPGGR